VAYTDEIQDTVIREKLRLFVTQVAEMIGDNDEAADVHNRTPDKLEYQDGFEFVAPCYLSFYWSSGTGTPLHDKLVECLLDAQEYEWAQQYPARKPLRDILALGEDSEFRSEAEEWELAAFEDEAIYIRVEAIRDHGDIRIRSCFMNEINAPYGDEFERDMPEAEFLALEGDELEALAKEVAEAPYSATLESGK
jgi:hypothetical protein